METPVQSQLLTSATIGIGGLAIGWLFWRFFIKADASVNLLLYSAKLSRGVFKDKVIWITGGSQGLGLELAKKFTYLGADVILSARNMDKLMQACEVCQQFADGNDVKPVQLDLTSSFESMQECTKNAVNAFGHVNILIHNAGVSQHGLMEETEPIVVEEMFKLNTLGPILLTRAFIPYMVERGAGHLVVISSMAAKVPSPGQAIYAATKSALHGFFNSLQTELADKGISVTMICPGPVASAQTDAKRTVYGPKGLITQDAGSQKGKVQHQRAVDLIALSVYKRLQEVWIAKHPVLGLGYFMQFVPLVGWKILNKFGPARAKALASGKSGYDVSSIMQHTKQDNNKAE